MRCDSCSKFCGIEQSEPQAILEVDSDGMVNGNVTLELISECCSDILSAADLEVDIQTDLEHKETCADNDRVILEDESAEATDRYQNTDRHGKPIKSFRYMRHFYGAELSGTVKCAGCGATAEMAGTVEEQASAFEQY